MNTGKMVAIGAGALVLIAGAWYALARPAAAPGEESGSATTSAEEERAAMEARQKGDTSDAALERDAAAIDVQLQAAASDSDSAQSFNDAPVQQTE